MLITVLKVFYKKQKKPKIIQYSSYKNFDNQGFQRRLNSELHLFFVNNKKLKQSPRKSLIC